LFVSAPQGSGRYQELGFNFSLTPHQANKIANSRDLRPGKLDYNVQVCDLSKMQLFV
jgi:hypothetical protein